MNALFSFLGEHWGLALTVTIAGFLLLVLIHDLIQKKHAILHNFPVLGHIRYLLEHLGPEFRQYIVAHDKEEAPFNRNERRWVYATSKGQNSNFGFGTTEELYSIGYPIIKQSTFPIESKLDLDKTPLPCLKQMGAHHNRRRPYRPALVNISAMSYGSLGKNAISALNIGASKAHCYHNTGEGGVSPYHRLGGDLVWQLGTGYFGARNSDGSFNLDTFAAEVEKTPRIRAIEIKLSQGAKPGKGGILPAAKVTADIAQIRGIPVNKICISPNHHKAFHDVESMIDFIELLAETSGLPIGIKSAVGELNFWTTLAERMKARNAGPDFISIDGGEGGTGAAPLTYSDHVSLPFKIGFARVYEIFQRAGLSESIVWIGSGKLGFPDRTMVALAMGCDIIHVAREAMLAIGCIQAQKCHTGGCPAGVATHNRWLQAGLNIDVKSKRFARYIKGFHKELLTLANSMAYEHPSQIQSQDIEFSSGVNRFQALHEILGYISDPVEFTQMSDYPCQEKRPA